MKRDARIGLAVVLVLGLSITLLVARSIHQHAAKAGIGDEPTPAPETAAQVAEAQPETAATIDPEYGTQAQAIVEFQTQHDYTPGPTTHVAEDAPPAGASAHPVGETTLPGNATISTGAGLNTANVLPSLGQPPIPMITPPAVADTEVAASTGGSNSYTIAAGDNPWKISAKVFGDGKYAQKIVDANPGLNPSRLRVGQKIVIPAIAGVTARMSTDNLAATSSAASVSGTVPVQDFSTTRGPVAASSLGTSASTETGMGSAQTHKVQAGETLGAIASKYLGSSGPKSVKKLMDANPGVDPRRLKIGQELKIPAP